MALSPTGAIPRRLDGVNEELPEQAAGSEPRDVVGQAPWDAVDQASWESFPASDAPPWTLGYAGDAHPTGLARV